MPLTEHPPSLIEKKKSYSLYKRLIFRRARRIVTFYFSFPDYPLPPDLRDTLLEAGASKNLHWQDWYIHIRACGPEVWKAIHRHYNWDRRNQNDLTLQAWRRSGH